MAFTVTRHYGKYRISTGDGKPVDASGISEVKEALTHYWGDGYDRRPGSHHFGRKSCPLCRYREAS